MRRSHKRALEACERALKIKSSAPDTIRAVVQAARSFLAGLTKPVSKISKGDVRRHLASVQGAGVSLATHKAILVRLRIFFGTLLAESLVERDPTQGLEVESRGKRPPPQPLLSQAEVETVLSVALDQSRYRRASRDLAWALALRDRATLELLYGLGLRRSEAGRARVLDLDLCEGSLKVRRSKRGESRALPLPRRSVEHLGRYVTEARPLLARGWKGSGKSHLLLAWSGAPLRGTGVGQLVARVARAARVTARPHLFRRALATHLVQAGVSLEAVRQLLGHTDLDSTAIYLDLDRGDLRRAVRHLET